MDRALDLLPDRRTIRRAPASSIPARSRSRSCRPPMPTGTADGLRMARTRHWIAINPDSASGNTFGFYSTTFNLSNPLPAGHLCLVGAWSHDDNGLLAINGTAIMGNISGTPAARCASQHRHHQLCHAGNQLPLFGLGSTDNHLEGLSPRNHRNLRRQPDRRSVLSPMPFRPTTPPAFPPPPTSRSPSTTRSIRLTVNSTTLPVMVGWNSNQEIAGNYQVNGNVVTFTPDTPFPTRHAISGWRLQRPARSGRRHRRAAAIRSSPTSLPAARPRPPPAPSRSSPSRRRPNATNVGLRAPVVATFNRSFNSRHDQPVRRLRLRPLRRRFAEPVVRRRQLLATRRTIRPSSSTATRCRPARHMTAFLNSSLQDWHGNALTHFTSQFTTTSLRFEYQRLDHHHPAGQRRQRRRSQSADHPLLPTCPSTPPRPAAASRWRRTTWPFPARCRCWITATRWSSLPARPGLRARSSSGGPPAACPIPLTTRPSTAPPATSTPPPAPPRSTPTVQVASPPAYTTPCRSEHGLRRAVQHAAESERDASPARATVYLYDQRLQRPVSLPVTYSSRSPTRCAWCPRAHLPANHLHLRCRSPPACKAPPVCLPPPPLV